MGLSNHPILAIYDIDAYRSVVSRVGGGEHPRRCSRKSVLKYVHTLTCTHTDSYFKLRFWVWFYIVHNMLATSTWI